VERAQVEALWNLHGPSLLLYATSMMRDRSQAEDVVQTVFTRLLALRQPSDCHHSAAYLFLAVRNESLTALRTRRRAANAYERLFEVVHNGRASPAAHDRGMEVQDALFDLPRDQRESIVLKIWGKLSFQEAASVLGVPEKTFEHRYYRALTMLKSAMDKPS
jgi:RNA polymerase sigma-70 factor (ECF subfamily)